MGRSEPDRGRSGGNGGDRLNILVIDRSAPLRASQGNELIARRLFPLLREHRLTLVAAVSGDPAPDEAGLLELFDDVRLVRRQARMTSLGGSLEPLVGRTVGRLLGRHAPRLPGNVDLGFGRRFEASIRDATRANAIDVVHVRQLPVAAYRRAFARIPALLELVDSETLGASRAFDGSLRTRIRRTAARLIERALVKPYEVVTTVAEADASAVRALVPGVRVEVVPNGVDATVFDPAAPGLSMASDPDLVVYVGAMSFPPNVAAVEWFARAVFPALRARRPGVRFAIVGRDPAPSVRALAAEPGVEVTGTVDDVRPWLARAAVVVCPMISGSGIKNKLLEALAMARPVVATSLAVEGMALVHGRDLLIADTVPETADAVAELMRDPERAAMLGRNGRATVRAHYTWEAAAARYEELWRDLAAGRTG
jgi:glycosyltransferase involved in cell wall biosynthesis